MPLKKNEVAQFKKQLELLKIQIQQSLKGSTDDVKRPDDNGSYSQHQADKGTDNFDRTISLEITGQEYAVLKQIERALEKIAENTYGVCDVTGEEIPKGRLEAVPYANMTVKAQEMVERGLL